MIVYTHATLLYIPVFQVLAHSVQHYSSLMLLAAVKTCDHMFHHLLYLTPTSILHVSLNNNSDIVWARERERERE